MNEQYRNILVVRTDRIGDVILTTPSIAALRARFPQAKIDVLVSSYTKDLLIGNPNLDEILVDERKGRHQGMFGYWRLVREIQRRHYDLAIIFHTKRRSNLLCFLAGIKKRLGYRDKNYGFLLTQPVEDVRHRGEKHESQYCLDLLGHLGVQRGLSIEPFLPIQPDAWRWVETWISQNDLAGKKLVAVHPWASDLTKCWPLESFAELIREMSKIHDCRIVVFGSRETVTLAKELGNLCAGVFLDLTGRTTIAQTSALLKKSHLLISNDSGPVHIGAAAGIFVICLFLRNQPGINPQRWRPLGPKSFILSNKENEAIRLDRSGRYITSGAKDSISVQEVLALARDLLQRP